MRTSPSERFCGGSTPKLARSRSDAQVGRRLLWHCLSVLPTGCEDKTLKPKLLEELPGILSWAVEGCLLWQRDGLGTCESVQIATSEYRAESDQLARFIEETCIIASALPD